MMNRHETAWRAAAVSTSRERGYDIVLPVVVTPGVDKHLVFERGEYASDNK